MRLRSIPDPQVYGPSFRQGGYGQNPQPAPGGSGAPTIQRDVFIPSAGLQSYLGGQSGLPQIEIVVRFVEPGAVGPQPGGQPVYPQAGGQPAGPQAGGQANGPQLGQQALKAAMQSAVPLDPGALTRQPVDPSAVPQTDPAQLQQAQQALSPDQQQKYQQVEQVLSNNSTAQAQLQALLSDGALGSKDSQGNTLLDNLAAIAQGPASQGLDPAKLTAETIADITNPGSICQGKSPSCTAGSMQGTLAAQKPAEYARLVQGLSSGTGSVTLADGKTALSADQFEPGQYPSDTEGLLQPAFMEAQAQHNGGTYDNSTSTTTDSTGTHKGEFPADAAWLEGALTGSPYLVAYASADPASRQALMQQLAQANPSPSNPVIADYSTPKGGHQVRIVGYDPSSNTITFANTGTGKDQGALVTAPADQFAAALHALVLPGQGTN